MGGGSSMDVSSKLSEKVFGFGRGISETQHHVDSAIIEEHHEATISSKTMHKSGHVRLFERQLSEFEHDEHLDSDDVGPQIPEGTLELLKNCLSGFTFAKNGYSDVALDMIVRSMMKEEIPSGQKLLIEGRRGDQLYIVEEGQLEVFIRKKLVRRVGPGHVLGELALLYDEPRSATVVSGND